jgi:5-hydroxyisourate hydrolase
MISTHVLDAALGRPAAGVAVELERPDGTRSAAVTDDDGRVTPFAGAAYFAATGQTGFYPEVTVAFRLDPGREHHHVPLLPRYVE